MAAIWKHYIHSAELSWTVLESDSASQLKQLCASFMFSGQQTVQLFSCKEETPELSRASQLPRWAYCSCFMGTLDSLAATISPNTFSEK